MSRSFYVGAYWGPRDTTPDECAESLSWSLLQLAEISRLLGVWREKGKSESDSLENTPVGLTADSMMSILNRSDRDGDGKFRVGLWNGQELEASVGTSCGRWSRGGSFVLSLPPPEGEARDLYSLEAARSTMSAVVGSWNPDWAVFMDRSIRNLQSRGMVLPYVGWLTYIGPSFQAPMEYVRELATVEQWWEGNLIQIGDDPFSGPTAKMVSVCQEFGIDMELPDIK